MAQAENALVQWSPGNHPLLLSTGPIGTDHVRGHFEGLQDFGALRTVQSNIELPSVYHRS